MDQHIFPIMSEEFLGPLLEELLENPLMGVNITDGQGRVLFLNRTHKHITGHSPELYLGCTMEELAKDGLVSESATSLVLKTKQAVSINQVTSHRDHFYQVHAVPLKDQEGVIRYVINYLVNISDIVKLKNKIMAMDSWNKVPANHSDLIQMNLNRTGELIYQSKVMQDVVEAAAKVAEYEVSVLLTGPSGVGKEMIANLIHSHSSRSGAPFVKINCAAIPDHLLESELFGYEPGAFTGGNPRGKKGLIERSNTGTLLLDEIGDLPLGLQSKLLRVLQTHSLRHIGGHKDIQVNFRLISSTNANLRQMIQDKTFREDLYYRINVIEIAIPCLEERRDDIPLLANHFLKQANLKYGTEKSFDPDALHFLSACRYPGNVRELQNVIERAMIMSSGRVIAPEDMQKAFGIPQEETAPRSAYIVPELEEGLSLKELMGRYEKQLLLAYQEKYKSGVKMAEALQTDQSTISRKLSRYHIRSD